MGHWGPPGAEGGNLDNNLSTVPGGDKELSVITPNREHRFHLTTLRKARCVAIPGGFEFRGRGTAKFDGVKGYRIFFSFRQIEGNTYFTAVLRKKGRIAYRLINQLLTGGTKERFA